MRKIFNVGKEIITYKDIGDAITKIEYYLQHEEERIQIAKQ
jgi:spore maturation protein CgeB